MTQLIAPSTAAATSADFTVASGSSATLSLSFSGLEAISPMAVADIQRKDSAGNYANIGQLSGGNPSMVLIAAGTFRVRKWAFSVAFGVDQD